VDREERQPARWELQGAGEDITTHYVTSRARRDKVFPCQRGAPEFKMSAALVYFTTYKNSYIWLLPFLIKQDNENKAELSVPKCR